MKVILSDLWDWLIKWNTDFKLWMIIILLVGVGYFVRFINNLI